MDFHDLFDNANIEPAPATTIDTPDGEGQFSLHVERPRTGATLITVAGPLDLATTPRFEELVRTRLQSTTHQVLLDLSGVTFLSTSGLDTLLGIEHKARMREKQLILITGTHPVDRPLQALGLTRRFTYGDPPLSASDDAEHSGEGPPAGERPVERELQGT